MKEINLERVKTLLSQMQQQIDSDAPLSRLLITASQLQSETAFLFQQNNNDANPGSSLNFPAILHLKVEEQQSPVANENVLFDKDEEKVVTEKPKIDKLTVQEWNGGAALISGPTAKPASEELQTKQKEQEQNEIEFEVTNPHVIENHKVPDPVETELLPEEVPDNQKVYEVLEVDEAEIEAELQEIKRNAATINHFSAHKAPKKIIENANEMRHQPMSKPWFAENESSLNDRLKAEQNEVSTKLNQDPIKDLRKAFSVNDRMMFVNELFKGDEIAFDRSIKTINNYSIYPEADYWIRRELKLKYAWDQSNPLVQEFDQLVRRRFS